VLQLLQLLHQEILDYEVGTSSSGAQIVATDADEMSLLEEHLLQLELYYNATLLNRYCCI
jgi:hypothetical protein